MKIRIQHSKVISICALFALLTLVACDDSSSGVTLSEAQAESNGSSDTLGSSSSVTPGSSGNIQSSSSLTSAGSENSSSAVIPASSGELQSSSSSSATTKNSSSSVGNDKSSSSVKKEESSSSAVKASSSSAMPRSSSSEVAKQSSSSVVASSSSFDINAPCPNEGAYKRYLGVVYECVDGTWTKYVAPSSSSVARSSCSAVYKTLVSPLNDNMSYGEYTDPRDGQKYVTIDIDNKYGPDSLHIAFTAFAQNLKYHEKITLGANEQDDDTKVEMYCYNDSIEYCNDWWGGLYQWAEMMALPYECNSKSCAELIDPDGDGFHQGICPDGWHMITIRELLAASYAAGDDNPFKTIMAEVSYRNVSGNNNRSGMSYIAAGHREYAPEGAYFENLKEDAYLITQAEYNVMKAWGGGMGKYSDIGSVTNPKKDGIPARCVKDY